MTKIFQPGQVVGIPWHRGDHGPYRAVILRGPYQRDGEDFYMVRWEDPNDPEPFEVAAEDIR
jgi:hypothetical protein